MFSSLWKVLLDHTVFCCNEVASKMWMPLRTITLSLFYQPSLLEDALTILYYAVRYRSKLRKAAFLPPLHLHLR